MNKNFDKTEKAIYDMGENFLRAVKFTLLAEGIISDDPKDTGGLTVFGISSKWFPELVKQLHKLVLEGKVKVARDLAIEFYKVEYWKKAGCDVLTDDNREQLAICVFDTAVNCGVRMAKSFLLESYDWVYYLMQRVVYNTTCKTEATHLRGWTRRIARLYRYVDGMDAY